MSDDIFQAQALQVLLMARIRPDVLWQGSSALARDQPICIQDVETLRRLLWRHSLRQKKSLINGLKRYYM